MPNSPVADPKPGTLLGLHTRQWRVALILGISFFVVMWASEKYIPHPSILFPASAIALSVLFLEGIELWPIVYLVSLIGYLILGKSPVFLIILPIAQTIQAVTGAYLLRIAKVDPLFRRSSHIFSLLLILLPVALIVPLLTSFADILNTAFSGTPSVLEVFSMRYTGAFFSLLILTPFLLRWFAKPRFSRTPIEFVETVSIFIALITLDYFLFTEGISRVDGIPLVYFLFIPLFWIGLRLRPRFVTLALLITSIFAISSLYIGPGAAMITTATFDIHLFQMEVLLVTIATMFLIIASLEEDRRLNSNLMHSQMATLENAVARISSESNAKNDFIAVLAHELRNPLAPVVTAIDLLKLAPNRDPEEMETLEMMEGRMQIVRRLLDDLLDISRISEGKLAIKKERVDLETVIRRAIISNEHHLKERHQALVLKDPSSFEHLTVEGDPVRLEQVFSNLLTNASKYSDSGDQITLTAARRGNEIQIVVSDMGVGLTTEAMKKIFTPFHQIDLGARSKKGLGIGLALVRSFVEMHDGTVVASSKGPNQGSQFTVTLPLFKSSNDHASLPSTHATDTKDMRSVVRTNRGPKVLVVDDNDAAASSMGRLLELQGCSVSYAYDGRQAIEKAASMLPDIVLLDLGLPDQDGYTVAKTMRARGYHGRIIALTGYSGEEVREKGSHVGFEHYLVKPAGLSELKKVIPEIA